MTKSARVASFSNFPILWFRNRKFLFPVICKYIRTLQEAEPFQNYKGPLGADRDQMEPNNPENLAK